MKRCQRLFRFFFSFLSLSSSRAQVVAGNTRKHTVAGNISVKHHFGFRFFISLKKSFNFCLIWNCCPQPQPDYINELLVTIMLNSEDKPDQRGTVITVGPLRWPLPVFVSSILSHHVNELFVPSTFAGYGLTLEYRRHWVSAKNLQSRNQSFTVSVCRQQEPIQQGCFCSFWRPNPNHAPQTHLYLHKTNKIKTPNPTKCCNEPWNVTV